MKAKLSWTSKMFANYNLLNSSEYFATTWWQPKYWSKSEAWNKNVILRDELLLFAISFSVNYIVSKKPWLKFIHSLYWHLTIEFNITAYPTAITSWTKQWSWTLDSLVFQTKQIIMLEMRIAYIDISEIVMLRIFI